MELPRLALRFEQRSTDAVQLVADIENARVKYGPGVMPIANVELAYELAFLRVYIAWEEFLEQLFYRLLCGYTRAGVVEPLKPGEVYSATIADAEARVLSGSQFASWHDRQRLAKRAQRYFLSGNFETVISSYGNLDNLSRIRHRIAHSQRHARQEFDVATTGLTGKRYAGSRPGRFLRDIDSSPLQQSRWLVSIARQMIAVAKQLSP